MSQAARSLIETFGSLPEADQKSVAAEILRRSVGPDRQQENDLLGLSVDERIQLAGDLWDSIAAEAEDLSFTEGEWAEIERRRAEHAQNPSSAIPWEEVRERLFRRFA